MMAGIIPAYAGSTRIGWRDRVRLGDHPRVCGEHRDDDPARYESMGSSPRMRGARRVADRLGSICRIIPTYAGSTILDRVDTRIEKDHPRVCGEHTLYVPPMPACEGSSPRMRGALVTKKYPLEFSRIIPAYAGSTS